MKLSEVSRALGLSRDTVRFYADSGMLKSEKNKESGYGECDVYSFFDLVNALGMRSLGFSVQESKDILSQVDIQQRIRMYEERKKDLERQQSRIGISIRYLEDHLKMMRTLTLNTGRMWFEQIPAKLWFPVTQPTESGVQLSAEGPRILEAWSKKHPFVNGACRWRGRVASEPTVWYYSIEEKLAEVLDLPDLSSAERIPPHIALCTVIDSKGKNKIASDILDPLYREMDRLGAGSDSMEIFGCIIARSFEDGQYHRYIKLEAPYPPQNNCSEAQTVAESILL